MTGRRDAAFAATLAAVLALGVLAVLLLNTSMQQQSRRLDAQRAQAAALAQQVQQLQTVVDLASDPELLATKARQMNMGPATRVKFLRSTARPRRAPKEKLSGRRPGVGRGPAG